MVIRANDYDIGAILSLLSERLVGDGSKFFVGEDENVSFLLDLVRKTVEKGESNSLLVLGPSGVGKSALVRHVLYLASAGKSWKENVVLVNLNGSLHTDDVLALKAITIQLNLENVVGDKVFGSFADHLSFLLTCLKSGDKTSKPIIFVLEKFDMFCAHKNQTLLYNLFDTAQSRAAPIFVIGLTCQIDVTELLEKRVSSRFSHRQLNLTAFDQYSDYYKLVLQLLKLEQTSAAAKQWNRMIADFWQRRDVEKYVEDHIYAYDKSVKNIKRILYLTLVNMIERKDNNMSLELLAHCRDQNAPHVHLENVIVDLSIVEVCLLISAAHISDIYDNEPFNFEMVKREFVKFKRRRFPALPGGESVVMKCWENLIAQEFILPKTFGDRLGGQQSEYILNTSHLPRCVLKKAIENYKNCPIEVVQWMSSSVHV